MSSSIEVMVILVSRYVGEAGGEIEPLPIELADGKVGIPTFLTPEDAKKFHEASWDVLGPGWEPLELTREELAMVLEKVVDEDAGDCVILNPPPGEPPPGGTQTVQVIDIRELLEALREDG